MSKHNFCQCPYSKRVLKGSICCEGGTRINFGDAKGQADYYKQFCCGDWKSCSIAATMNEFYERKYRPK